METVATQATKTVEGYFGKPKQITRDDFVKRWTEHFVEVFSLANSTAEYEELKAMKARIAELAGAAWERIPS